MSYVSNEEIIQTSTLEENVVPNFNLGSIEPRQPSEPSKPTSGEAHIKELTHQVVMMQDLLEKILAQQSSKSYKFIEGVEVESPRRNLDASLKTKTNSL